jgi:hypothetical protein
MIILCFLIYNPLEIVGVRSSLKQIQIKSIEVNKKTAITSIDIITVFILLFIVTHDSITYLEIIIRF